MEKIRAEKILKNGLLTICSAAQIVNKVINNKYLMKNSKLAFYSFLNALGTIIYVSLVALVMSNGNRWFGPGNNILGAIAILSLLVLSAAIVGALVLGRPILWYLDGKKSEGIKLFLFTLAWLFVFTMVVFVILASVPKQMVVY
jgi:hypothetical protein